MKYPAIYKSVEGSEYLYQNKDSYYCYERQVWDSSEPHHDCHHSDTNITAEYLANTYGEVKSKGHAEFIKLLAETNKIPCAVVSIDMNYTMFYVLDGCLFFCLKEIDVVGNYKKITIPLPPECEGVDEWPKVGSIATWGNCSHTAEVIAIHNNMAWLFTEGEYHTEIAVNKLQKPKTPEQELQEDLINIFQSSLDGGHFVGKLMSKYNITKKGEGGE